jgi:hypothetical protein
VEDQASDWTCFGEGSWRLHPKHYAVVELCSLMAPNPSDCLRALGVVLCVPCYAGWELREKTLFVDLYTAVVERGTPGLIVSAPCTRKTLKLTKAISTIIGLILY